MMNETAFPNRAWGQLPSRYTGFAYPLHAAAPHHFTLVEDANGVVLSEIFGAAGIGGRFSVVRAVVPTKTWRGIRDHVRARLNDRINDVNQRDKGKQPRIPTCKSWTRVGPTLIGRILGLELCVLLWSLQGADEERAQRAVWQWAAYRPEELYWLFQQADLDGREWDSPLVGYRAALPIIMQHDRQGNRARFSSAA